MSKKVIDLTDDTIKNFLSENHFAVVDFWNPMCGPCNELAPVFQELARKYSKVCAFGKMNLGKDGGLDPYLRQKYLDGQGVPVLLFFKDGKRVDRILGYYENETPGKIKSIIKRNLK